MKCGGWFISKDSEVFLWWHTEDWSVIPREEGSGVTNPLGYMSSGIQMGRVAEGRQIKEQTLSLFLLMEKGAQSLHQTLFLVMRVYAATFWELKYLDRHSMDTCSYSVNAGKDHGFLTLPGCCSMLQTPHVVKVPVLSWSASLTILFRAHFLGVFCAKPGLESQIAHSWLCDHRKIT